MLLYIMETISGMFGIVAMRYNKKWLFDRFRNSVVSSPYLELDNNLLKTWIPFQDFELFI
jgi:hypothetical protein